MPTEKDSLAERDGFELSVPSVLARKRPIPASFGSLSAPLGAAEPDRYVSRDKSFQLRQMDGPMTDAIPWDNPGRYSTFSGRGFACGCCRTKPTFLRRRNGLAILWKVESGRSERLKQATVMLSCMRRRADRLPLPPPPMQRSSNGRPPSS